MAELILTDEERKNVFLAAITSCCNGDRGIFVIRDGALFHIDHITPFDDYTSVFISYVNEEDIKELENLSITISQYKDIAIYRGLEKRILQIMRERSELSNIKPAKQ